MDVSENLVELLSQVQSFGVKQGNHITHQEGKTNREIASHLIANGVTVQEWISVKDRLPKADEIVTICTDEGFVYAGELVGDTWFLDNDSWTENVTHWMPLPEPPKGE